jgi:hypothetical protein
VLGPKAFAIAELQAPASFLFIFEFRRLVFPEAGRGWGSALHFRVGHRLAMWHPVANVTDIAHRQYQP